ncbi:MAG: N-acetylneuraminate synthase family protein [Desulfobulbaceae bacterium]|nr:N-acetylneuraminate synthase family protein [Desulfobulbaceae bacterium]
MTINTYIIAEIGNNHNGSVDKAVELINKAAEAGADAVKFQSFRGLDIVTPKVRADEYPGWNVSGYEYWYQFLDSIALPLADHQKVIDHAHDCGLDFITTPVSPAIVDLLERMTGIDTYKVASMDLNNFGLLHAIAATDKKVILSTGMGALSEVDRAVDILGKDDLSILHCVSDYPLEPSNAALNNLNVLKERFPRGQVGFSDHSLGHELIIAAVAMGARVIEKHVTLDRNDPSPAEHHFALEPDEFAAMIKWVRSIDENLSISSWQRSSNEGEGRLKFRRSFHYNRDLPSGQVVDEDDLLFTRPGDGIGYEDLSSLVGRPLCEKREAFAPCLISDVVVQE